MLPRCGGATVRAHIACALLRPQPHAPATCRRGALVVVAAKKGGADEDDDEDDGEAVSPGKPMRVERLLANLGYGKRRECQQMVKKGHVVRKDGGKLKVGDKVAWSDLELEGGEQLDPPGPLLLALNKPTGYVVTAPDDENISDSVVYDLLPYRFGRRRPFLSCVGRLDKDTSGLLLLTDDGTLLHRVNSPKKGIWKVYEATLADPLSVKAAEAAAKKFASGTLTLEGDYAPLLPARLERTGERTARVAICEGRYHQVRRMFAAVGNKVVGLRRVSVGGLALGDLPEGEWRFLSPQDLEAVFAGPSTEDIFASSGNSSSGGGGGSSSGAVAAERDGGAAASTSGRGGEAGQSEEPEQEEEAGERLTKKEKKKGRKEDVRAAKRAARSGPAAADDDDEEAEEEDLDEVADVELLEFGEDEEDEMEAAAAARRAAAAAGGRRPRKPRRATVRQGVVIDGKGQGVEEEGLGPDVAYEGEAADVVLSSGAGGGVRKYKDDTRWRRRRDALKELLPNKQ